jgi:RNA polymerase sigma factor (sigma-70 family)
LFHVPVVDEECMESLSAPLPRPAVRPLAGTLRLTSDARLARLAASGSEGAMAAIFERHHQALHRYCHSILGNGHDAADALQNTMIKALRSLPGETRQIALRPWLYRIAYNESISVLRARRSDCDLDAAVHIGDMAAAGLVDSRERVHSLTTDLGQLTERQRGALLMRELGGLEFSEVADALGTSAAAVKQSVYEARCALQAMEEGRAMDCDVVRRTLSDGDRRMLRGVRMRSHLRACRGCRAFEVALRQRPRQLAALAPPLPLAAATAMLHGILGGGSTGGGAGLAVGLAGTAKATTGFSVGAKALAVVAVSTSLAGGAVYAVPELASKPPSQPAARTPAVEAASAARIAATAASVSVRRGSSRDRAPARRTGARGSTGAGSAEPTVTGAPGATPSRDAAQTAGRGKPAVTPARGPGAIPARKPAAIPARQPAVTAMRKPAVLPARKPAATPAPSPAGRPAAVAVGPPTAAPSAQTPGSAATGGPPVSTPGASAADAHSRP